MTKHATAAAERAAREAADITEEIERYEALASQRRRRRALLWAQAQRGGCSYRQLGEIAGLHPSKVHEAVVEHRARRRRR